MGSVSVFLSCACLVVTATGCGGETGSNGSPGNDTVEVRSEVDAPQQPDTTSGRSGNTNQQNGEPTGPSGPTLSSQADMDPLLIPPGAKFVSRTGDDSWPGTEDQPWHHILPSLQRLQPGDTLVIRGGTYTATGESESCGNGNSPFGLVGLHGNEASWTTIMGYPGERPKLYHADGWQTLYICDSSYVKILHLEVFGDANRGNTSPTNGVYVVNSHHIMIDDVWSHDNGGCGICTTESNHITIQGSRVWGCSHWNPYHSSGISLYFNSNLGGGNSPDGYSNRITGNLVWNNYEDDSLGEGQQWGVTDGNGIIVDRNNESDGNGRTLIENNVLTDNGGPGIMVTESHAVDVFHNSLFENVRTQVPTVMNNGEIGCNGGYDITIEGNIVVPRKTNKNLFQDFSCRDVSFAENVWVRTRGRKFGASDTTLPTGSNVLKNPQLEAPGGNWTSIGEAKGRGAR